MSRFYCTTGDMRSTAIFRQNNPIANSSGGFSDNYADLLTCRCRLLKMKGMKKLEQGEIVQNQDFEMVCRYQAALVINVDTIVVISGITYRIENFEKVNNINHFYRFILSQK